MLGEYTKGLEVANQIKLFAPSEYLGYRIAKEILLLQIEMKKQRKKLTGRKIFQTMHGFLHR